MEHRVVRFLWKPRVEAGSSAATQLSLEGEWFPSAPPVIIKSKNYFLFSYVGSFFVYNSTSDNEEV